MATINLRKGGANAGTTLRRDATDVPFVAEFEVDLAAAAVAKGSALATGDLIQALELPANSYVIGNVGVATIKPVVGGTVNINPDNSATYGPGFVSLEVTGAVTAGVVKVTAVVVSVAHRKNIGLAKIGS